VTKTLKKLIKLRTSCNLSQVQVAKRMKVSRQQINNIESGRQGHPSIFTIEKYARAIKARIFIELI
jgi:transcriptional regulator with XRE-family HTH domain